MTKPKQPHLRKRLRAKGKTPNGTHIPIMPEEIIATLKPKPSDIIADCTLGYGGHARQLARYIGKTGKIIGLDVDGSELEKTQKRLAAIEPALVTYQTNYANIAKVMKKEAIDGFDIIFADLGVSSMQVDDPSLGISYKHKGPLDMRMNKSLEYTGADLLNSLNCEELSNALLEFSDEPDHQEIAEAIIRQRKLSPITQTGQLVRLVFKVKKITQKQWDIDRKKRFNSLHPAARTFQSLRILVNDELDSLKQLLKLAPQCLANGGRIGIISFHSSEDRLVKRSFKENKTSGIYTVTSPAPLVPRRKEIMQNPRSSSAKFRYAQKK